MSPDLSEVPKLSGYDNAPQWSKELRNALQLASVWSVVSDGVPEKPKVDEFKDMLPVYAVELSRYYELVKAESTCLAAIYCTVDQRIQTELSELKTSREMWELLIDTYVTKTNITPQSKAADIVELLLSNEFQQTHLERKRLFEMMRSFIDINNLSASEVVDIWYNGSTLASMKREKRFSKVAADLLDQQKLSVSDLDRKINTIASSIEPIVINAADGVTFCRNCGRDNHLEKDCKRFCTFCKVKTHSSKWCSLNPNKGTSNYPESSFLGANKSVDTCVDNFSKNKKHNSRYCKFCKVSSHWSKYCFLNTTSSFIVDSGASRHISIFPNLKYLASSNRVKLPDGSFHEVKYEHNIKVGKIQLKRILYCPTLNTNIISVSELTKEGYSVRFYSNYCEISKNGKILHKITTKNGIYYLNNSDNSREDNAVVNSSIHERIGHLSKSEENKLKSIIKSTKQKIKPLETIECKDCAQANFKKKSVTGSRNYVRATSVLEIIHMDVWKAPEESVEGYKYYCSFTDDVTRFSMIYEMYTKDEVFHYLKVYCKLVENKFNKKIKKFISDNGGEYCNDLVDNFCKENGYEFDPSPPYIPELNGVSERLNQTLETKARVLKIQSGLPWSFWPSIFQYANFLRNISPTQKKENTPFFNWFKKHPKYSMLRKFGCLCYARIVKKKNQ